MIPKKVAEKEITLVDGSSLLPKPKLEKKIRKILKRVMYAQRKAEELAEAYRQNS